MGCEYMKQLRNYEEVNEAFDRLFPLCRSILGKGYRDSLEILKEYIPFEDDNYVTGSKVLNWEVPKEWVIREAWIKDSEGNTVIDFKENNLHVINYSYPIDKVMELEELKKYIYTSSISDDAIPYSIAYYKEKTGFCMSKKQLDNLKEGKYHAYIDSEFIDGRLVVGETVLSGKSQKEIMLTSYLCHPSMANNELSGPLVLAMLYQKISKWTNRKYTYRFVVNPETIGSISYLSRHGEYLKNNLQTGIVLTCLGGKQTLRYKTSRTEQAPFDTFIKSIQTEVPDMRIESFVPYSGSDERQYCSPGFDLPVGQFARMSYGDYPEYHSSLDTKELMGIDEIIQSAEEIEKLLLQYEKEEFYINTQPNGEVKLGNYDLYPKFNSGGIKAKMDDELKSQPWFVKCIMTILSYGDEKHSLSFVAQKMNLELEQVKSAADILAEKGLIEYC